ncbi:MAG: elongation factor G [Myxococcota bacterium]|jgi:elongation factor G
MRPVLLQLPIGSGDAFRGVMDLVYKRALLYDLRGIATEAPIPADMGEAVDAALERMIEAVAMADDALVESYLGHGELTLDEIRSGLEIGLQSGDITPVLLGSAAKGVGVERLLWLARAFPDGAAAPAVIGRRPSSETVKPVAGDPDGPFAALCVKTTIDRFAGLVSVLAVIRGTLTAGTTLIHPRTGDHEKVGGLFHLVGSAHVDVDAVVPGDIFAAAKAKSLKTGDTLCDAKSPRQLDYLAPRPAMISYTIAPRTRREVDKLKAALGNLLSEDPALREDFDEVTKEVVLAGMGAAHVRLAVERMQRKYGVSVDLGTPAIPYRETITGRADVRYRRKKQTGGAGQFGEVAIRVFPSERGHGYQFQNAIKGGVIPGSLIPSVDKGVRDQLDRGVLAAFRCSM